MGIYCGTDIIEIKRIQNAINEAEYEGENIFLKKIFTEGEVLYCNSKGRMRYEHYAVRFSAKEAVFKAISNLLKNKYEISWQDIEVENDDQGRPKIKFNNIPQEIKEKIKNIDVSLSHCKEYAVAMVVIEEV